MKPATVRKNAEKSWDKEFSKRFPTKKGWLIRKKGFPDRIMFNKRTKELRLYELKGGNHEFHKFQKEMLVMFKEAKKISTWLVVYDQKGKKLSEKKVTKKTPAKGWEEVEPPWLGGID